jgi:hypothetical protein
MFYQRCIWTYWKKRGISLFQINIWLILILYLEGLRKAEFRRQTLQLCNTPYTYDRVMVGVPRECVGFKVCAYKKIKPSSCLLMESKRSKLVYWHRLLDLTLSQFHPPRSLKTSTHHKFILALSSEVGSLSQSVFSHEMYPQKFRIYSFLLCSLNMSN